MCFNARPTETPISSEYVSHIDEEIFRITDTSDKPPEKIIVFGRGHNAPSNDERIKEGYLTPKRETFKKSADRIECIESHKSH